MKTRNHFGGDITEQVNKELINMVGKGRGVYYILRMKRTISGQLEKMDIDTLLLNIGAAKKVNSEILEKGFITNRSYQELNDVGKKTAYLELSGLIEKGLLLSTGKGRSVRYVTRF